MKLAQLCEDKGKACAGFQPSNSIWVLSSLGPGGTWDHTSHEVRHGSTAPLWPGKCSAAGRLAISCFFKLDPSSILIIQLDTEHRNPRVYIYISHLLFHLYVHAYCVHLPRNDG